MNLTQWLESVGLAKYTSTFAENDIDFEVLAELSEADLEKLGLPLGTRDETARIGHGLFLCWRSRGESRCGLAERRGRSARCAISEAASKVARSSPTSAARLASADDVAHLHDTTIRDASFALLSISPA